MRKPLLMLGFGLAAALATALVVRTSTHREASLAPQAAEARGIGEDRPEVKSPYVDGLYFVGDQYGERLWGGGVDGASLCAAMCADSIMGTDLEFQIFPPYHRGIPKKAKTW